MNTTTSKPQKHQLSLPFLLRLLCLLMIFSSLSISLPNIGIAAKVYRTGIDPISQPFEVYDTSTRTWTNLGTVDTGAQLAVSADQKLYMYERTDDWIQVYDPVENKWENVLKGPGIKGGYGNLEVTNDGEFILTYSMFGVGPNATKQMHYTVGGTWNTFTLPEIIEFDSLPIPKNNASALADYDHATGTFVVGKGSSEAIWKIDLSTFPVTDNNVTTFKVDASFIGEIRRFGEIYNGRWYSQSSIKPITHYNLSEENPLINRDNSSTLPNAEHYSATVDHDKGIFYVNSYGISENTIFATWVPKTETDNDFFTTLPPAPSALAPPDKFDGHSTIAFVNQSSNRPPVADAGPAQTVQCTSVTLDGSASTDPDGDSLTYTWSGDFVGGITTDIIPTVTVIMPTSSNVTLTVSDGTETDMDDVFITVQDNTPPTLTVPANTTVEYQGDTSTTTNGTATGADNCNQFTVTHIDSSVAGCGNTEVITRTWTVTDLAGNSTSGDQTITVVDTTAPVATATLVPVKVKKKHGCFRVEFSATDICDTDPTIDALLNKVSVTNGQLVELRHKKKYNVKVGDGDSDDDSSSADCGTVKFEGPDFTLTVTATDDCGNEDTDTAVPVFEGGSSDDRELKKKSKNALKKKWRKRYSKDNSNGHREWWNWRKWRNWRK